VCLSGVGLRCFKTAKRIVFKFKIEIFGDPRYIALDGELDSQDLMRPSPNYFDVLLFFFFQIGANSG